MARPPRPPRKVQQEFLAAIEDQVKATALGAHLAAKGMGDATRISRWRSLEVHLRFDELVELLNHMGEDAGVALEWIAHRHGYTVVRLPTAADGSGNLALDQLRVEAMAGELSSLVAAAYDPDGDGGVSVTPAEAASIERVRRKLQQALAALDLQNNVRAFAPGGR